MEKRAKEIAEYAAKAYGFLIPRGDVISGEHFANEIREYYDALDLRHQECADVVQNHVKAVQKLYGGIVVWFKDEE